MRFSIIIPTLGLREEEFSRLLSSLESQTHKDIEVIIVSQDNHKNVQNMIEKFPSLAVKHIKSEEKGLSLARNKAIPFINGDVVTFSDDDCWYPEDALNKVAKSFDGQKESDVICFQIYDPVQESYYKPYPQTDIPEIKMRQVFQRSSIEIFIQLSRLKKEDLRFNENFGLGARYPSGEENIMLSCLFRKGYKISYENRVVVYHAKPSQKSRLNLNTFKSKGPLLKEIFGPYTGFLMLSALFLKKIPDLEKPFTFYLAALKEMYAYKRTNNI
ncbi:glycosyltransferase [Mesobacillus harenae]|uniref:glycosyltransferase n=1 Tax=Mesobacillus harenae TaxID=2213203 RepID=UPI001580DBAC